MHWHRAGTGQSINAQPTIRSPLNMSKFLRSRKMVIATAVAGVGVLGVGVAGAVGGIPITPGPSEHADSHPAPEATTVTLPAAASAGSGNAAAPPAPAAAASDTSSDSAPDVPS